MNKTCPFCIRTSPSGSGLGSRVIKHGTFRRFEDLTLQQRYRCLTCKKSFSSATLHPCYRQRRRQLNSQVFHLYVSGCSQRRIAKLVGCNPKTMVRKFLFLSTWAEVYFKKHRDSFLPSEEVEFDDLETFEHSKMKPLSVAMVIESKTRRILGFNVARMPAKGLLVKRALKKYGYRKDERAKKREELFKDVSLSIAANATIKSDENPHYPKQIKKHFRSCQHKAYKGRRGCVVGQGELKSGGFDPLFTLNHTFAMFRANLNRLFRRTWNTTKKPDRLEKHLWLYCLYHNLYLL